MNKIPEHVAIIADAAFAQAGSLGGDGDPLLAARLLSARAALGFAESSAVRYLTLCIETADRTLDADAAARLAQALRGDIDALERRGLSVQIAQRSGRADLVRATRRLAEQVRSGALRADDVTLELLQKTLSSAAFPDPDLIILCGRREQTSADSPPRPQKLSGCLLFECAYAELHFCAAHFSDFDSSDWHRALYDFSQRDRRFGRAPDPISSPQTRFTSAPERSAAAP